MADLGYYARLERMRRHHKRWLWLVCGRCCITLQAIGQQRGGYTGYACHHLNYGSDRLWWSVLPVSKSFHDSVLHGVLSGGLSAGEQRRKHGRYPNLLQTLLHWWGRFVLLCLLLCRFVLTVWRYKFELATMTAIGLVLHRFL
ncbi:MAG: hypothetical protein KME42_13900 [Tildeniella nuda ZEHNDER 1965/U140]|jgi:hypothetical protein|nr:hypothetical protein [Tildeniella nuda ZEHNDER 1965/U140]